MKRAKTGLMLGVGALALVHASVAAAHDWRASSGALVMDSCLAPLLAVAIWRLRHDHAPLPWPHWVVSFLTAAALIAAVVFTVGSGALLLSARRATREIDGDVDYLVVLGAALSQGHASRTLAARLDCAREWLSAHPSTPVVVSGGKGPDETMAEADVMATYLTAKGVAPTRILREDTSRSTWENMRNTRALLSTRVPDRAPRVLVATSDFHVFRSLFLAERAGLRARGLACPTPWDQMPNLLVRECLAVVKSWRLDRPASR